MAEEKSPQDLLKELLAEKAKTAQLEKERNEARDAQGKAEQELLDANTLIDDLNQSANGSPTAAPVVKLGKAEYRVVVPQFRFTDGKEYSAADVTTNSDLLKQLVKMESGVVELVEDDAE